MKKRSTLNFTLKDRIRKRFRKSGIKGRKEKERERGKREKK